MAVPVQELLKRVLHELDVGRVNLFFARQQAQNAEVSTILSDFFPF